jgi:ceramide glucosyltransferase
LPPLSILKPAKGWDEGLEENLRSFFTLDYPEYEIIFSVGSADDKARPAIEKLLAEYPQVPARLVIGEQVVGKNPKVNNLIRAFEISSHEVVLISDSNVRVEPDYLRNLVPHFKDRVGIVTAVVGGTESEGVGGHLEAVYLNTFYARWMHVTRAFGFPTVVGKSMLFRKSTAARFGGIRTLACYIAEDYMAGQAMKHLGLKVEIAPEPVPQFIGKYSFHSFWERHLRWGRIRKSHAPLAFLFEPIFMSILSGAFGALAAARLDLMTAPAFFFAHLCLWYLCDILMMINVDRLRLSTLAAWWLRELLAFPQWVHMAASSNVKWRGEKLFLHPGGFLGGLGDER